MKGFTLLELMVTLAILAIILGIGVSSFIPQLDSSHARAVSDSLRASIAQTRSESITRGGSVRLCGSSDGTSCVNTFNDGWIIYHDSDNSGALSTTDNILTWHEQEHGRLTIRSGNPLGAAITDFGFNYRGYPSTPLTFGVNSGATNTLIELWAYGRVEIQ